MVIVILICYTIELNTFKEYLLQRVMRSMRWMQNFEENKRDFENQKIIEFLSLVTNEINEDNIHEILETGLVNEESAEDKKDFVNFVFDLNKDIFYDTLWDYGYDYLEQTVFLENFIDTLIDNDWNEPLHFSKLKLIDLDEINDSLYSDEEYTLDNILNLFNEVEISSNLELNAEEQIDGIAMWKEISKKFLNNDWDIIEETYEISSELLLTLVVNEELNARERASEIVKNIANDDNTQCPPEGCPVNVSCNINVDVTEWQFLAEIWPQIEKEIDILPQSYVFYFSSLETWAREHYVTQTAYFFDAMSYDELEETLPLIEKKINPFWLNLIDQPWFHELNGCQYPEFFELLTNNVDSTKNEEIRKKLDLLVVDLMNLFDISLEESRTKIGLNDNCIEDFVTCLCASIDNLEFPCTDFDEAMKKFYEETGQRNPLENPYERITLQPIIESALRKLIPTSCDDVMEYLLVKYPIIFSHSFLFILILISSVVIAIKLVNWLPIKPTTAGDANKEAFLHILSLILPLIRFIRLGVIYLLKQLVTTLSQKWYIRLSNRLLKWIWKKINFIHWKPLFKRWSYFSLFSKARVTWKSFFNKF